MDRGTPGIEQVANTGALRTCLLSERLEGIPITIDRTSARFSSTIKGACLYGKQSSGGKYAPFFVTAVVYSQAAASQKDIICTGLDLHFLEGDSIIIMDDNAVNTKVIDTGGVVEGVANTTITVTVNLSATFETAANAKVYLVDGTEDSANAVVVLESVDFSISSTDWITVGYNFGEFNSLDIGRVTNFTQSSNGSLQLRAI
jgi:hypothetical protein